MRTYRPVPVAEVVLGELDNRYLSLMEEFPSELSAVLKCRKRYSTWSDGEHSFHRVSLCRKRHVCAIDAKVYAYGLADDAVDVAHRLYSKVGGKLEFGVLDFPLPRDMRSRIKDDELPELRRIAWKVIVAVLGQDGMKLGGVGVYQWWSSSDPMSGYLPHLHMTIFNMAFREGRRVKVPVYVPREKLDVMKTLWRSKVEARWGVSKYSATSKSWVVFAHYSSGYGHLRHRLAYAFRYPVVDLYKAISGRGYVSRPADGWVRRMLIRPEKEKRIQWFGWMAQRWVYHHAKLLDLEIPKKKEREKENGRVFCPYCGKELRKIAEGLTREEIDPLSIFLTFSEGGVFGG